MDHLEHEAFSVLAEAYTSGVLDTDALSRLGASPELLAALDEKVSG